METVQIITQEGQIEIPKEITDILGTELKSTCINDVWLVITSMNDSTFTGEPLVSDGAAYYLPEHQMSALGMSPGDKVLLVFNDVLGTIILKKLSDEAGNT